MLERVLDNDPRFGDATGEKGRPEHDTPGRKKEGYAQICLLGQPPLSRFLEFAEDTVVEGAIVDRAALIDEWRAANDYYQELERSEAGIADQGEHRELDPGLATLAAQVKSHPSYRSTFDTLPTRFGMVELDRLIVHQWHITRNFVDALKGRIGPAADLAALFRICLPLDAPETPVQIQRVGSRRYVFRCESEDFGFHEPALLRPEQADESFGAVAGIVGLVLGFGSNFLTAVRVGNRMLLNNGYHRAYALRALGITHAPCAIQMATRVDELQVIVNERVAANAQFYLASARPPLLKDFFDPKIRKVLPIRKKVRQIEVDFEIRDVLVSE